MLSSGLVQEILIWTVPVLFAVTVHETAHGFVANIFGDKTALLLGRLTLNPIKHIDIIGTIIVPLFCLILGGFVFGWAKPVPINPRNLRNPKRDMAFVAFAGPFSNLLMALIWALIAKMGIILAGNFSFTAILIKVCEAGIYINLVLMILNLIPIPPLDGSRVVSSILPTNLATIYDRIEPYGFIILIILLVTNVLSKILGPALMWLQQFISHIFAI
jgi:Zn-dependent protease